MLARARHGSRARPNRSLLARQRKSKKPEEEEEEDTAPLSSIEAESSEYVAVAQSANAKILPRVGLPEARYYATKVMATF